MKSKNLIFALLLTLIFFAQGCSGKHPQAVRYQDLGNGIIQDTVSGLMWQSERSQKINTFEEAQLYVKDLNLGRYSDWRLPTVIELYDLNYFFDRHLNGTCDLALKGRYWSGEKDGDGMAGSWDISNQCDPVRRYFSGTYGYVRAVRL